MKEPSTIQLPSAIPASRGAGAVTGLAALSAVFGLPASIDAAVVYSGIQNISATLNPAQRHASNATAGFNTALTPLDVDGIAGAEFNLRVRQNRGPGFGTGSAFLSPVPGNVVQGGEGGAYNLQVSNNVPVPFFSYASGLLRRVFKPDAGGGFVSGSFAPGVAGFVGVQFQQAGSTHYGWVRLQVDDGPQGFPDKLTVVDWAYEDVKNTPIHVELLVPEANPGMVLLAAGGTGLAAWRLRKRKQTAPAAAA
jgi:hypothetical protein